MALLTRTAAIVAVVALLAACAGPATSATPYPTSTNVYITTGVPIPSGQGDGTPAPTPVRTQDAIDPVSGLHWVSLSDLPPEAAHTVGLIKSHGPFPHSQDGVVFENREGILPNEPTGSYHEYTVETPGSSDRGARRIVTGSNGEMYYTDDHYASFERIRDD